MNVKRFYFFSLLVSLHCFNPAGAQDIIQTIRGTVYDSETRQPLSGASVYLKDTEPAVGTTTDEEGAFRLEKVPIGRYILKASFVGYETFTIPDLLVQAGKETILDIALTQAAKSLSEVVVREQTATVETIEPVSSRTFSVEETRRYAATFFDPARLATSFPGVVGTNDQGNHISVRGNSPASLLWRLEGIDIVNPNHLSNAGTFNDRRVASSGSQSILSTQVLDNSTFLSGAFPARYGNAIGGVFDMRLRKGNNEQYEYTVQAGLIGLEFAAEGPFQEGLESSFLANYRYSTVGLLTNVIGLDFGGEKITFQDLSFNLSFPTKKSGEFTVFGIGGLGSNVFEASRDSSAWETAKDRYDITFTNDMGALGVTHTYTTGQLLWKSVVATSGLNSNRFGDILNENYEVERVEEDDYQEIRLSATSSVTGKISGSHSLNGGFFLDHLYYRLSSAEGNLVVSPQTLVEGEGKGQLIRPYMSGKFSLSRVLTLQIGLHYVYFTFNGSQSLEPRASLQWNVAQNQSLNLAYGLHSQLQLPGVYFSKPTSSSGALIDTNEELGFTKAHHYVFSYSYLLDETSNLRLETYYQRLFDVPVSTNPNSTFSALNLFEGFVDEPLVNEGTGKNYGAELTLEKSLSDSYYLLFSSSLYESKYTAADGIQRDTRFNGNYTFSFTGGKEFAWDKEDKKRVIGINLRAVYLGGMRTTPINVSASEQKQMTVFDDARAFSQQLPDYFKIDLRVSLRMNRANYTSVLSLDLQNALNQQNVAFQYYDAVQDEVITKYQLGLIPILTYRIEF